MAKYRSTKRKRRKLRFEILALFIMIFTGILSLAVSLFVGTKNNELTIEIQNINSEISVIKNSNDILNIEIQTLQNKERIYVLAQTAGLNQNQDNIVAISGE